MIPFALLALTFFFVTTALGRSKPIESGTVTLEAGKRYRLIVLYPASKLALLEDKSDGAITAAFAKAGALEAQIIARPTDGLLVSAIVTAPVPTPLTIGQTLLGPAKLVSVEKLSP